MSLSGKPTCVPYDLFVLLITDKIAPKVLADKLGLSVSYCHDLRKGVRGVRLWRKAKAEGYAAPKPKSRLTVEQLHHIYTSRDSVAEMAERMGCSQPNISKARQGRTHPLVFAQFIEDYGEGAFSYKLRRNKGEQNGNRA